MKIPVDEPTREILLTGSPEELEELARDQPALAPLIRELLGAHEVLGRALTSAPPPKRHRGWIPWAAAASVAALVVSATFAGLGRPVAVNHDLTLPPPMLDVEAPGDFAVFPTDDPDISIVWILNGDE